MNTDNLKYDANGLIPAIVQDDASGAVLMVAYMNRESLAITLQEKRTCFYSRSRKQLWRKGETSGNVQHVISLSADCDGDALLVRVKADGPACHTGQNSCFFNEMYRDEQVPPSFSLGSLYQMLEERKIAPKEGSYTSYLFEKGREKILKKVGEESAEVLIGAMKGDKQETLFEIADLCYHALVLMVEMGIGPDDVLAELAGRHVVDKKTKQETMQ